MSARDFENRGMLDENSNHSICKILKNHLDELCVNKMIEMSPAGVQILMLNPWSQDIIGFNR